MNKIILFSFVFLVTKWAHAECPDIRTTANRLTEALKNFDYWQKSTPVWQASTNGRSFAKQTREMEEIIAKGYACHYAEKYSDCGDESIKLDAKFASGDREEHILTLKRQGIHLCHLNKGECAGTLLTITQILSDQLRLVKVAGSNPAERQHYEDRVAVWTKDLRGESLCNFSKQEDCGNEAVSARQAKADTDEEKYIAKVQREIVEECRKKRPEAALPNSFDKLKNVRLPDAMLLNLDQTGKTDLKQKCSFAYVPHKPQLSIDRPSFIELGKPITWTVGQPHEGRILKYSEGCPVEVDPLFLNECQKVQKGLGSFIEPSSVALHSKDGMLKVFSRGTESSLLGCLRDKGFVPAASGDNATGTGTIGQ